MDSEFDDFSPADTAALTRALEEAERRAATQPRVPLGKIPSSGGGAGQVALASPAATPARAAAAAAAAAAGAAAGAAVAGGGGGGGVSGGRVAPTATVQQPVPQKINRTTSSIIVSTRQKGNPVLIYIKNVPWEYGDIIPDYVVGKTACALFLSLKYHRLHPEYIYNRILLLGHSYNLRILLVMVDIENHQAPLLELSKTCHINNLTLILSWTSAEAGRYIETYKSFENASPTLIQEKPKSDYSSRMQDVCTAVRGVNKTDALNLVTNFGSVRAAVNAPKEELLSMQGWGAKKAMAWDKAVSEPFRIRKARAREDRVEASNSCVVVLPDSMIQTYMFDGDDEDALMAEREREREPEIEILQQE